MDVHTWFTKVRADSNAIRCTCRLPSASAPPSSLALDLPDRARLLALVFQLYHHTKSRAKNTHTHIYIYMYINVRVCMYALLVPMIYNII